MPKQEARTFLPPMAALLNEYGTAIATILVPNPKGDHVQYEEPIVRMFSAAGDGDTAQSIEFSGLPHMKYLRDLLSEAVAIHEQTLQAIADRKLGR